MGRRMTFGHGDWSHGGTLGAVSFPLTLQGRRFFVADDRPVPFSLALGAGSALPLVGTLKASSEQTRGAFEVIELTGAGGPPPHVHREREEAFYVLEGSVQFVLGDDTVEAGQGSFVFVPCGIRHGFRVTPGARALVFISPAGLEGFFRELGEGLQKGRSGEELRAALAGKYDSEPA